MKKFMEANGKEAKAAAAKVRKSHLQFTIFEVIDCWLIILDASYRQISAHKLWEIKDQTEQARGFDVDAQEWDGDDNEVEYTF